MVKRAKRTENMPAPVGLGQMIRSLRKKNGLTQGELAKAVQVDESYISKIETGRLSYTPSEDTLRLMAQALGADALILLGLAQKTPHELRDVVDSQPARQFFQMVREEQLSGDDWNDLSERLRRRISKRQDDG